MIMTLADAGLGKLNVIGTSDTAHYLATMRSCLVRYVNTDLMGVNRGMY
jgi:hypothetical protein